MKKVFIVLILLVCGCSSALFKPGRTITSYYPYVGATEKELVDNWGPSTDCNCYLKDKINVKDCWYSRAWSSWGRFIVPYYQPGAINYVVTIENSKIIGIEIAKSNSKFK